MKTYVLLSKKFYFSLGVFLCVSSVVLGQTNPFEIPDTLIGKTYVTLYNEYKKHISDTTYAKLYLNTFLQKATEEDHKINRAIALNELSYYAVTKKDKLRLIQASLLESNSVDSMYSIPTYNNLGLYYKNYYDYENALEQYLKVVRLAQKINDKTYEGIALNNIAKLKTEIGDYARALKLYKRGFDLENNQGNISEEALVIASVELAESYRYNKKYDSASYYYHTVITLVEKNYPYVLSTAKINEGINAYYKRDFNQAQLLLEEGTALINLNSSYYLKYYILAQFYLGKINESLDKDLSMSYYQKIDSLLTQVDIVIPEVRETYEFLEINYEKNNDYEGQLYAIDKLLKFDSITAARKINTSYKLNAEFDTPELLRNKELLIKKLENKNHHLNLNFIFLFAIIIIALIVIIIQFRRHRLYKIRFDKLVSELNNKPEELQKIDIEKASKDLNIDPRIVTSILHKLQVFESKNGFLKNTVTITLLAKKLSTNTKYLSKIINTYKGKTFVHYINDLRIEYILQELKVNPRLRHYTILSIAKEASFNSVGAFTGAFRKKTGISPSYYIKNL
ncbi:helix-turn-helix domain-containing protein [Dokdonia pacifica]|uniref:AraC-type DNA-binding protein n=1 Tax=Dokdonia pacifica TaxID=1627892 RepID=A0A239BG65_9FLAO|nr:helix-turn-helix domain-containing protein [Dokdonia pacifica]SNS06920.1 AraC-type DNA-binding protein [Dokdonia pacifica]